MFSPDAARPAKRVYLGNLPPDCTGTTFFHGLHAWGLVIVIDRASLLTIIKEHVTQFIALPLFNFSPLRHRGCRGGLETMGERAHDSKWRIFCERSTSFLL